ELIELINEKKLNLEKEITNYSNQSEALQEKLIREGNGITVEELKDLKQEYHTYRQESDGIKNRLRKLIDVVPLVMAGKKLTELYNQLEKESKLNNAVNVDLSSIPNLYKQIQHKLAELNINTYQSHQIVDVVQKAINNKGGVKNDD